MFETAYTVLDIYKAIYMVDWVVCMDEYGLKSPSTPLSHMEEYGLKSPPTSLLG
jgi:hypothetical protein